MSLLLQALQRAQQEAAQAPEPIAAGATDARVSPPDNASVPTGASPFQPEDAPPSAVPAGAARAEVPPLDWQLVLPDAPLAPPAPASASVSPPAWEDALAFSLEPQPEAAPSTAPDGQAPAELAAVTESAAAPQGAQSPLPAFPELPSLEPLPQDTAANHAQLSESAAAAAPEPTSEAPASPEPTPPAPATSASAPVSPATAPTEQTPPVALPPAAEESLRAQAQRRVALWPRAQPGASTRSRRLTVVLMGLLIVVGVAVAALWGWEMWFSDSDLRIAQLPQSEHTPSEVAAPDVSPVQGSTAPDAVANTDSPRTPPAATPAAAAPAPSRAVVPRAGRSVRPAAAQAPARQGEDNAAGAAATQPTPNPDHAGILQLSAVDPTQRARAATAAGDWAVAERAWADVLQQQPRSIEAWLGRAHALVQLQRYEAALDGYQRALAIDPRSAVAQQGWWAVLARVNPAQAQIALEAWLEEHPDDAAAWRALGNANGRLHRWADALHAWQQSAAIDQQVPDVWVNIAIALDQLRRYDEAQLAYRQALQKPLPPATRQQVQHRLAALADALQRPPDGAGND